MIRAVLKDRHGNDLYFGNADGIWLSPLPRNEDFRERLKKIRHLELRDGDVILTSFPRSGTFWHHEILYMLLHNTTDYLGRMEQDNLDWIELEKLPRPGGAQICVTHLRYHNLPQQAREKKVKVIYCYRNPKDCWVSFYHLVNGIEIPAIL
ncbi:amine sulfotransferase-like isoform X2 [Babylonia areolata]|uniref:amine sulfotransferase-like isoform X2 n=1 Tax=Babylonia areolata TaxID=304850 RepID=UPI003FD407D8